MLPDRPALDDHAGAGDPAVSIQGTPVPGDRLPATPGPGPVSQLPGSPSSPAERLRSRASARLDLALLSAGHFMSDVYGSLLVTLMPLWVDEFGLSLSAAGLLVSVRSVGMTLGEPVGGHLGDSTSRLIFPLGLFIVALAMSAAGLAPSYLVLMLLVVLATAGSSLFGPQAAAAAARVSGGLRGLGVGLFLAGGAVGGAVGPVAIAALVSATSLPGTWVMILPGALICALLAWRFAGRAGRVSHAGGEHNLWSALRSGPVLALAGVLLLKGAAETGIMTFLPILVSGKGGTLIAAGATVSLFKLTGAATSIAAGYHSDRSSWKPFLVLSFLLSIGAAYLLFRTEGLLALVAVALLGATLLSSTSYTMVLAQNLLPGRESTATGLVWSLSLLGGAVGALAGGFLADGFGVAWALLLLGTVLPLGAAVLSLGIQERRPLS